MLFNFPCFIINEKTRKLYIDYIDYALSCRIKHAGNKVWNAYILGDFERIHEAWLQKNVYCL
jgi:hypothetical protein